MKLIKLFFLGLILYSSTAFASGVDLSEHGKDLMKAPFAARIHFYNTYHINWMDSTYSERKSFLTKWHQQQVQEAKETQAKAKAEAIIERAKAMKKRAEQKAQADKEKAEARQKQEEEKEDQSRQKKFNERIKSQEHLIQEMQHQKQNSGR